MTSVYPPWKYIFIIWSMAGIWWLSVISSLLWCISLWLWCPPTVVGWWSIEPWLWWLWSIIFFSVCKSQREIYNWLMLWVTLPWENCPIIWCELLLVHLNEFRASKMWDFHLSVVECYTSERERSLDLSDDALSCFKPKLQGLPVLRLLGVPLPPLPYQQLCLLRTSMANLRE